MSLAAKDKFIIEQIHQDVDRGMELLINAHHVSLCVCALKYVDDFEMAEDIVQDVLINFWENKRFRTITTSLKSYLLTAVRNKALKYREKSGRYVLTDIEDELEDMVVEQPENAWLEEQAHLLKLELAKLPVKRREVLESIIFKGMKYKEVAEEMNISLNTVKTHFSKSLRQLRSSLRVVVWLLS
jgi:RNA polymerase sigma-70 factor (ECF subfamily)